MRLPQNLSHLHSLILGLLLSLFVVACQQDAELPATPTEEASLTDEEAVALIEASLQSDADGISQEMVHIDESMSGTVDMASLNLPDSSNIPELSLEDLCNMTQDTTIDRSYTGPYASGAFTTNIQWTLFCDVWQFGNLTIYLPDSLEVQRTASGTYTTARIASQDSMSAQWTISNLLSGNYLLSGNHVREGTTTLTFRSPKTVSSSLAFSLNQIEYDRNTLEILSGTGQVMINSTGPQGGSFQETADLTFLGDGEVAILINGNTYIIDFT